MQISSVSQPNSYPTNGTQSVVQLQKLIVNLQKQVADENQSKTDTAEQQQIQQYQAQMQKLSNSIGKSE
jgi:hypothetical protein